MSTGYPICAAAAPNSSRVRGNRVAGWATPMASSDSQNRRLFTSVSVAGRLAASRQNDSASASAFLATRIACKSEVGSRTGLPPAARAACSRAATKSSSGLSSMPFTTWRDHVPRSQHRGIDRSHTMDDDTVPAEVPREAEDVDLVVTDDQSRRAASRVPEYWDG